MEHVPGHNATHCQALCVSHAGFLCRAVTFDPQEGLCSLSPHTRASAGPALLQPSDRLDTLEISTCFQVSVECRSQTMKASIQTNAVFRGKVYAKTNPVSCSVDVESSTNFILPLPLAAGECGTVAQEEGKFYNEIVIQSNDHVVTATDKAVGIHCSYDVGNKTEEALLNVTDLKSTDNSRASPELPSLSLHIVDLQGQERDTVSLGEVVKVQVRMSQDDTYGIFVRNLVAKDGTGSHNLTLIDGQGCPVEVKMMREVRTVDSDHKSLEGYLETFAFTGSSRLELEAEVQTCRDRCKPVACKLPTARRETDAAAMVASLGRRRREADGPSVRVSKRLSVAAVQFGVTPTPAAPPPLISSPVSPAATGYCLDSRTLFTLGGGFLFAEVAAIAAALVLSSRSCR